MKIALITNVLPPEGRGGAELYVHEIAQELASRHDVLVLSGSPGAIEGADTIVLPALPTLRADAPTLEKATWHLRDQWSARVRRSVASALGAFRPDVVFSHEPQGLSASVFGAIAAGGYRHVHMTHDFNLVCARTTMTTNGRTCGGRCAPCVLQRSIRLPALKRRVDRLVAPSEMIRTRHLAFGFSDEGVVTIRHGSRNGRVTGRGRTDTKSVGFIGTLGRHKGVPTLLDAFAATPADWRLVLAGTGPLEDVVRERAADDDRIRQLGFVTGEAKESFFAAVDLLVVPSECEEVAPLVVVEAAARAVPVVVSDRGGLPEAPAAEVFPAGDADALGAALRRVLDDPDRLERERQSLRDRHGEFLWDRHVAEIEALLVEVAEAA